MIIQKFVSTIHYNNFVCTLHSCNSIPVGLFFKSWQIWEVTVLSRGRSDFYMLSTGISRRPMKLIDIYRYVEVPIFFCVFTAHIPQDARIWTLLLCTVSSTPAYTSLALPTYTPCIVRRATSSSHPKHCLMQGSELVVDMMQGYIHRQCWRGESKSVRRLYTL